MSKQKLSVIVSGRNDDYISDNSNRIKSFFGSVRSSFSNFDLEIIFVEYNNLKDRKHLHEEIDTEGIRWIIVPNEFHKTITDKSEFGVMEYVAKNIGVARANSDFLVIGNPDIIFCNSFPLKSIDKKKIYFGSKLHITKEGVVRCKKPASAMGATGDFMLVDKKSAFSVNGFRIGEISGCSDTMFAVDIIEKGSTSIPLWNFEIWHVDHHDDSDYAKESRSKRDEPRANKENLKLKKNNENWGYTNIKFDEVNS